MRYGIDYLDNFSDNYGDYFVKKRNTKEIIYDLERAKYMILRLDPYDAKNNYVYLSTDVTRLLSLKKTSKTYGNGAVVYKSFYFCNGLWDFNLHINSNLNCYMLVLVHDFGCRPPYIPDLSSKLMSPTILPGSLMNQSPTLTAPDSTLYVSPIEDMEYTYVKTKKYKPKKHDFDDIDDSSDESSSEETVPKKKKTNKKAKKKTINKKAKKKKSNSSKKNK